MKSDKIIQLSSNPFLISALIYLTIGLVAAITSGLSTILGFESLLIYLIWTRIHFITIGTLLHIFFGIIPQIISKRNVIRWDIWALLNVGFLTFLTGRSLIHEVTLITGGTMLFLATILFTYQIYTLSKEYGNWSLETGELYYLTGFVFFLIGIIVGTGIWVGWSKYLAIKVPIEVHIHANNWGLVSFVFVGLVFDRYENWTGTPLNKRLYSYIYYLMVFGAIGLIFGPWFGSLWLSVPGLLFHMLATILFLYSIIKPVNFKEITTDFLLFLSGYIWFLAPVVVAPLVVFRIGNFYLYSIEAFAPEALVYGWLLSASLFFLLNIYAKNTGSWISLVLIHTGAILLWISIFVQSNTAIYYELAYIIWGIAIIPTLVNLIPSLFSQTDKDLSPQISDF